MTKFDTLKKEALEAVKFRGHKVGRWVNYGAGPHADGFAMTTCKKCGRMVFVDSHPRPNGIEISGEAVALGCGEVE